MHTISSKLNELEKLIYDKVDHPYINKFLEKPFIDLDKLAIFYYLYEDKSIDEDTKKRYIITIMLVQLALDTHELLPSPSEKPMQETKKQLSVLTGDYYSGLYYYLLAEIEDILMIRTLANAIEQINEYKMTLYKEDVASLEELLAVMEQVEARLFREVAQNIGIDETMTTIITKFLMTNRLYQEKQKIRENQFSYIANYIRTHKTSIEEKNVLQWIEQEMLLRKKEIETALTKNAESNTALSDYVREKLLMTYHMMIAEEG